MPDSIQQAEWLTQFAVQARYPGTSPPMHEKEYQEALKLANEVVLWAEKQLRGTRHHATN